MSRQSFFKSDEHYEVKVSQLFSSHEQDDLYFLKDPSIDIKVDKLVFDGAPMIQDYQDGRLQCKKGKNPNVLMIESKLKSNSKNPNLKKNYRLEFLASETKIRRTGTRKFELKFRRFMSLVSDDTSGETKDSNIDIKLVFPPKNSKPQAHPPNPNYHKLTLRVHDRELSNLGKYFYVYRHKNNKPSLQSQKSRAKYETARYLKDPNEPRFRKEIEKYEKKIVKAKKKKILERLKEIPYPRFWAMEGASKSSMRKGENGLLKRVKQTSEFSEHPFKSKVLCPIYSCFKVFDSPDKANEHLKKHHLKVFESGFRIKENGKLQFDGNLDRMALNTYIFSKFQNEFIDKVINEKGKKKIEELKRE